MAEKPTGAKPLQLPPERAGIVSPRRITIPQAARQAVTWSAEIGDGAKVVYELTARGCVRMRRGNALDAAVAAAMAAGDERAAARLSILLLVGSWQTPSRVTLPELVTDRLFGVGIVAESLLVWGTQDAIELWSDQYWLCTTDEVAATASEYVV